MNSKCLVRRSWCNEVRFRLTSFARNTQTLFLDLLCASLLLRYQHAKLAHAMNEARSGVKRTPSSKQGVRSNWRRRDVGPQPSGSAQDRDGSMVVGREHDEGERDGANDVQGIFKPFPRDD